MEISRLVRPAVFALLLLSSSGCTKEKNPVAAPAEENSLYRALVQLPWVNLEKAPTVAQLQGRVTLLDFWTFCCINCMHVIPELHRLEQEFGDKLTVLGIHSAKFQNEKDSEQITQAILKYGIQHPVANDAEFVLWRALEIQAWPSFALIDAQGRVVSTFSGEGVYEKAHDAIARLIQSAEKDGTLRRNEFRVIAPRTEGPLRFPGKLLADEKGGRVFVSDSEHQRILALAPDGRELLRIGSGVQGLKDGTFAEAQFHSPQGIALRGDQLYVADTENHALRVADLTKRTVRTLFGTGRQARISYWSETLTNELNSPWDLEWEGEDLLIAMAGTHQIYRLNPKGKLSRYAGSGREDLKDGALADAALAQTSGLSAGRDGRVYFVDSETSSLRALDGDRVRTLVGEGLFEFGLKDGRREVARLQHPLGVQVAPDGRIFVADTYNHALRVFDPKTRELRTLAGGQPGRRDGTAKEAQFREPNDLAWVGDELWIADTNNHALRALNLKTQGVRTIEVKLAAPAAGAASFLPNLKLEREIAVPADQTFTLRWEIPSGMKINPKTPSPLRLLANGAEKQSADARGAMPAELRFDLKGLPSATLEGTLYYCNSDGSGACRIESLRLKLKAGGSEKSVLWKVGSK